jgi:hypothetical protein
MAQYIYCGVPVKNGCSARFTPINRNTVLQIAVSRSKSAYAGHPPFIISPRRAADHQSSLAKATISS